MTEIRTPRDAECFLREVEELHDGRIDLISHRRNGDVEAHFSGLWQCNALLTFSGDVSYCAAADDPTCWHTSSIHFMNGFVYLVDNSTYPGFLPEDPGDSYRWFRARRMYYAVEPRTE